MTQAQFYELEVIQMFCYFDPTSYYLCLFCVCESVKYLYLVCFGLHENLNPSCQLQLFIFKGPDTSTPTWVHLFDHIYKQNDAFCKLFTIKTVFSICFKP